MNEIFLIIFSLSISGSLIALLLFLLKPIVKDRLSKTWQYYIFLVVIVRLFLPFGPDTSLMGMVFNQVGDYIAVADNSTAAPNMDNLLFLPDGAPQEQADEDAVTPISPAKNIGETLLAWLWLAWLVPAVLFLFRKVANYYRYTRAVKNGCSLITNNHILNIYRETCVAMDIKHAPRLAMNEQVAAPMVAGIIQPVIVLPDTKLKDIDMRYVFQHELTHYKRLDIAYKWLVQVALCLHWFNPAIYWVNREINRNCELSCDENVIRRLDEKDKYAYGDMLLGAIRLDKIAPRATVSLTLSEDTKLIKERLKAILTHKRQSRKLIIMSALLAVCLFCGAACAGSYTSTTPDPVAQNSNTPGGQIQSTPFMDSETPAAITEMGMQYYEDTDPVGRYPYLHWIIANNSNKTINDYEMVCLAYDKDGKPLELDWTRLPLTNGNQITGFTNQSDKSYEQMIALADKPILPGEKEDLDGGWSLYDGWNQADGTHNVAYVLACMKQVTFDDGTVWENPGYQDWLSEYKGKRVGPETLDAYYT